MKTLARLASPLCALALLALPSAASAAFSLGVGGGNWFFGLSSGPICNASTICGIAATVLYVINNILVPIIFAIAFLVFIYGIARAYIFSNGQPEMVGEGHRLMLWGILGFVIMVSLWGIVNVVANTFGLGGYGAPPTPTSYPTGGSGVYFNVQR